MSRFKIFRGFTLAEVLITLGIIGVVAAMTIPTLISNYQKQQTVTRLEKIFSTITSAVKMAEAENGSMTSWAAPTVNWDTAQSKDWWDKYFIPYANFSTIKKCTSSDYKECWSDKVKHLNGAVAGGSGIYTWVLKDGTFIMLHVISSTTAQIFVDTNGFKDPNIIGRDIFLINIFYKSGFVGFAPKIYSRIYLLENHDATCNKDAGASKGSYCGAVIQMDGWQIKDDYPWN